MKTAILALSSLLLTAGCALPSAEVATDSAPAVGGGAGSAGSGGSGSPAGSAEPAGPPGRSVPTADASTIYAVRRPGSLVAPGAHVVLQGQNLQITAVSTTHLWVQEAADGGGCEIGAEVVGYRAIAVTLAARSDVPLAVGQHVTVDGVVHDVDGHRTIEGALVHVLAIPAARFEAHCERDGAALRSEALDGVLVYTAGAAHGSPSLATCFGDSSPIAIVPDIFSYDAWGDGWYGVHGIITRDGVLPRGPEDVDVRDDDVCL